MTKPPPSLEETVAAMKSGVRDPRDVLAGCLAQIDACEGRVQAWTVVDREGAQTQLDSLLARQDKDALPLWCVPIGIKDIIDVAGLPTRCGSSITSPEGAANDAAVVSRLRSAGAIILGKTVTAQWACFDPPATRNPWRLSHTPGGSSSGSAAAVAAGMCLAALGTQTGGSIIRPASYCGVAGLKPSFGAVSRAGVAPVSWSLDHVGLFAASAADLALLLSATREEAEPPHPLPAYQPERQHFVVWDGWFDQQADETTRDRFEDAIERLRHAGGRVEAETLPDSFAQVHQMHARIMAREAAETHRQRFAKQPEGYSPKVASLIETGLSMSEGDYLAALDHQRRFTVELQQKLAHRIALSPATPAAAPADLTTTGDPSFNSPYSHAGLPAATIPYAVAKNGLPLGLQLAGAMEEDEQVLSAAAWCERTLGFGLSPRFLD